MSGQDRTPYLSMVVYSRADTHAGRIRQRFWASVRSFFELAEEYKLPSEIIIVDWNPPGGTLLLKDAYRWPVASRYCAIRTIVVPPEFHLRYPGSNAMPMNHYVARNVGIRRARGRFILSTVSDILFSRELMMYFAARQLKENSFYRIDRHDVKDGVLAYNSVGEQLAFCARNVIIVCAWNKGQKVRGTDVPCPHTNAAGDFIILSKEKFDALRGFPEIDLVGLYVDGIFCYMAALSGLTQVVLEDPCRIYHIDHPGRWAPPERTALIRMWRKARLPRRYESLLYWLFYQWRPNYYKRHGVPYLKRTQYAAIVREMIDGKRSFAYNDDSWGLGNDEFAEYTLTRCS